MSASAASSRGVTPSAPATTLPIPVLSNTNPEISKLRRNAQFATLSAWCALFCGALNIHDYDTNQLEQDLAGIAVDSYIPWLCYKLLYTLTQDRTVKVDHYLPRLRREFLKREPDKLDLLGDEKISVGQEGAPVPWQDLTADNKIKVLYCLCSWYFTDADRFRDKLGASEAQGVTWPSSSQRIEPVGYDKFKNAYWLFDDNRLWIERHDPHAQASQNVAGHETATAKSRQKKRSKKTNSDQSPSKRTKVDEASSQQTNSSSKQGRRTRTSQKGIGEVWEEIPSEWLKVEKVGSETGPSDLSDLTDLSDDEGSDSEHLHTTVAQQDDENPDISVLFGGRITAFSQKIAHNNADIEKSAIESDASSEAVKWECICVTLSDWQDFLANLDLQDPKEKALHKFLAENVMPGIREADQLLQIELSKATDSVAKQESEAESPRKKSTRIAARDSEREERERSEKAAIPSLTGKNIGGSEFQRGLRLSNMIRKQSVQLEPDQPMEVYGSQDDAKQSESISSAPHTGSVSATLPQTVPQNASSTRTPLKSESDDRYGESALQHQSITISSAPQSDTIANPPVVHSFSASSHDGTSHNSTSTSPTAPTVSYSFSQPMVQPHYSPPGNAIPGYVNSAQEYINPSSLSQSSQSPYAAHPPSLQRVPSGQRLSHSVDGRYSQASPTASTPNSHSGAFVPALQLQIQSDRNAKGSPVNDTPQMQRSGSMGRQIPGMLPLGSAPNPSQAFAPTPQYTHPSAHTYGVYLHPQHGQSGQNQQAMSQPAYHNFASMPPAMQQQYTQAQRVSQYGTHVLPQQEAQVFPGRGSPNVAQSFNSLSQADQPPFTSSYTSQTMPLASSQASPRAAIPNPHISPAHSHTSLPPHNAKASSSNSSRLVEKKDGRAKGKDSSSVKEDSDDEYRTRPRRAAARKAPIIIPSKRKKGSDESGEDDDDEEEANQSSSSEFALPEDKSDTDFVPSDEEKPKKKGAKGRPIKRVATSPRQAPLATPSSSATLPGASSRLPNHTNQQHAQMHNAAMHQRLGYPAHSGQQMNPTAGRPYPMMTEAQAAYYRQQSLASSQQSFQGGQNTSSPNAYAARTPLPYGYNVAPNQPAQRTLSPQSSQSPNQQMMPQQYMIPNRQPPLPNLTPEQFSALNPQQKQQFIYMQNQQQQAAQYAAMQQEQARYYSQPALHNYGAPPQYYSHSVPGMNPAQAFPAQNYSVHPYQYSQSPGAMQRPMASPSSAHLPMHPQVPPQGNGHGQRPGSAASSNNQSTH